MISSWHYPPVRDHTGLAQPAADAPAADHRPATLAGVRDFFLYGAGVPRYVALWLPLAPVLIVGLLALRVRRDAVIAVAVSTLPTFFLHNPPYWLPLPLRWLLLVTVLAYLVAWLAVRVRDDRGTPAATVPQRVRWAPVAGLALLAVVLRAPLAWADPGISDFATATETAARQLLAGLNPWTLPNPFATVGTYQYPIATPLLSLPFVAAVPDTVLGEAHIGARAAVWASDVIAVVLLAWGGARAGYRWAGLVAAFAYTVHPTLVRESGIVVANDLMLAVAALAAAFALAHRRILVAAALVGLGISIKPAAAVLLPLTLLAAGPLAALVAVAVPVALQLPFLVWPSPGLWGLSAIAEPLARPEPSIILELSSWWPVYALLGGSPGLLRVLGLVAVAAGFAVSAWAGWRIRHAPSLARVSAAFGLTLLVPFVLAVVQRTNYQDWFLPSLLLCAALVHTPARAASRPVHYACVE